MSPRDCCDGCEVSRDYSGVKTMLKGMYIILTLASGLLGYSVIWQAPNIRSEVAKEIARIDRSVLETKQELQLKLRDMEARVSMIESK